MLADYIFSDQWISFFKVSLWKIFSNFGSQRVGFQNADKAW